jgi:hypothetical protein
MCNKKAKKYIKTQMDKKSISHKRLIELTREEQTRIEELKIFLMTNKNLNKLPAELQDHVELLLDLLIEKN